MSDANISPIRPGSPPPQAGRVPPHDLGAERDLLGAIMISPRVLDNIIGVVRPDDFYKPAHGHIYTAIVELAGAGEPVDTRTVTETLTRTKLLDAVGGAATLGQMMADVPSTTSAGRYARIVRDLASHRQLIAVAGEIAEMGYNPAGNFGTALDRAEQLLYEIGDKTSLDGNAEKLADVLTAWVEAVDRRQQEGPQGTPTGLIELDALLGGGLRPGQLYTVAARPAMGKSLFGVQVSHHAAHFHDVPSLLVSAEMPTEELLDRLVAAHARVDNQRIRTGRLNETDWPRISEAVARLGSDPMWIYDASDITLASIRAQVRRVTSAARRPIGLLVVDYLQLLTTASRTENRQLEVDALARGLKVLARSLDVPVLALSQVNRNVESRADKRPMLADLRESGGIEAHSDGVIALYRDELYNPDTADAGTAELIVLKQRGGPIGTVHVAYLAAYGIFANMARV